MRTTLHLQPHYTAYRGYYQIKLPLEMETMIPADDPVRLLSAFVEGMDLSELYATYDRVRKNQATPRQMLKIMIYAAMNRLFSSRDIETACKRDINFMFLLEGMPVPDHSTIARFVSLHVPACSKTVLASVSSILHDLGEISGKTIFIDGTKSNPAQTSTPLSEKNPSQSIRPVCSERSLRSLKNVRRCTESKWFIMAKRPCIP